MNIKTNITPNNQKKISFGLDFIEFLKIEWISSAHWEVDSDWQLLPRQLDDFFFFMPLNGKMLANTEEDSFLLNSGCLWWVDENVTHWAKHHGNTPILKILAFHVHLNHRLGGRFKSTSGSGAIRLSKEWVHRLSRIVYFEQQATHRQNTFYTQELLALLLDLIEKDEIAFKSPPEIDSRIRDLLNWLEKQKGWIPSLRDCSEQVGLSTVHLRNLFQQHLGRKPHDYILRQRLSWARDDMSSGAASIAKIGRSHGFASPQQFHRAFKKVYGCTPAELRKGGESNI